MDHARAIKAVAFDAFGTLVEIIDERRPYIRMARASAGNVLASSIREQLDLAAFADRCGVRLRPEWRADLDVELASIRCFAESRDVLAALRRDGYRTAVASNLALPYAAPVEALLGDLLDVACLSFELGAAKPEAAFYQALCRRLDCAPSEILMIGDSWRSDYEGATDMGLQALHLDRRGDSPPARTAVTISHLGQLFTALAARP